MDKKGEVEGDSQTVGICPAYERARVIATRRLDSATIGEDHAALPEQVVERVSVDRRIGHGHKPLWRARSKIRVLLVEDLERLRRADLLGDPELQQDVTPPSFAVALLGVECHEIRA